MNLYEEIYHSVKDNRVRLNTAVQIAGRIKGKNLMEVINALNKLAKKDVIEQVSLGGSDCYKAKGGIVNFDL